MTRQAGRQAGRQAPREATLTVSKEEKCHVRWYIPTREIRFSYFSVFSFFSKINMTFFLKN
jgi:hypothetical protein